MTSLDDAEVLDEVWARGRGPGYFGVVLISLIMSAVVVVGAQLAVARWAQVQALLGGSHRLPAPSRVAVPAVTQLPLAAASELLASRGLKVLSIGEAADAQVAPGHVVTQAPASGARLRRGDTVQVRLSSGPPLVAVPAVVGTGLLEAQHQLEQAGLRLGAVEAAGVALRVTGTRPAPGEPAAAGAPVALIVEVVGAPPPPAAVEAPAAPAPHGRRR